MKFYKKKTDISGTETGDFYGFDASILGEELKPLNAKCDSAEVEITVYPIDDKTELDKEAITATVINHGSKEQVEARRAKKEKDEFNAPIIAQIDALDWRRVRPLAEGDTEYLKGLNEQIIALRSTLKK